MAAPCSVEDDELKDKSAEIGVFRELADALRHIGAVDRERLAVAVGGFEGDVVEDAFEDGL